MSVDPSGSSEVPPPTDPWPTDASVSPAYPPTAPLPPTPPAPPSSYPGTGDPYAAAAPHHPVPTQAYPVPTQAYPVPGQPYPGGGQPVSGLPWRPAAGPEPVIAQIGEIAVTSSTVRTPSGEIPLAGTQWHVADYWQSEQKTPTWAIVVAVLGFCVLTVFSLLFLLIKETSTVARCR